jgi:hypothetical protein
VRRAVASLPLILLLHTTAWATPIGYAFSGTLDNGDAVTGSFVLEPSMQSSTWSWHFYFSTPAAPNGDIFTPWMHWEYLGTVFPVFDAPILRIMFSPVGRVPDPEAFTIPSALVLNFYIGAVMPTLSEQVAYLSTAPLLPLCVSIPACDYQQWPSFWSYQLDDNTSFEFTDGQATPVPEPAATGVLALLGIAGLLIMGRRLGVNHKV